MEASQKTMAKQYYLKAVLYWIIFLLMYFGFKFFPCFPLKVICGITESNFQHYKASFFAWIILSLLEYLYLRKRIKNRPSFVYSRMATATILPWFVFLLWYIGPAVWGRMPSIPLEIVYANIITIIVGIFAVIYEQGMSSISYTKELRTVIIILTLASLLLYIVFTFGELPLADVFVEPDWR